MDGRTDICQIIVRFNIFGLFWCYLYRVFIPLHIVVFFASLPHTSYYFVFSQHSPLLLNREFFHSLGFSAAPLRGSEQGTGARPWLVKCHYCWREKNVGVDGVGVLFTPFDRGGGGGCDANNGDKMVIKSCCGRWQKWEQRKKYKDENSQNNNNNTSHTIKMENRAFR